MVLAAGDPLHQLIEGGGDHHSTLLVVADILVRVRAFVPNVDGVWGRGGGEGRGGGGGGGSITADDFQLVEPLRFRKVYSTMQS